MKRYPSIDFLRGTAIFLMVFLHTFMRWFDENEFVNKVFSGQAALSLLVLMIVLLFFGSFAGYFLMVSAIGNMISMFKGLQKGQNVKTLLMKQVIGGVLLLIFAYLAEGIIGYHGGFGYLLAGKDMETVIDTMLYRGYHMETIHTIAWCIIINGIVQGLLSIGDGWKKINRNLKIYALLAVITIVMTQFVWWGFDSIVPDGDFSQGIDPITEHPWQYGHLTKHDIFTNFLRIFWQPWAGQVEPIFPFLSVSFIGSIIGLYLMKRQEEPDNMDTSKIRLGITLGFLMAIIGLILTVLGLLNIAGDPFDNILLLLRGSYDITYIEGGFGIIWLPYFILITGCQIGVVLLIFRLVEFRGKADSFAKKTLLFRRFGFVAFSVYTFQFLDVIVIFLLSFIPGFPAYATNAMNEVQIWVAIVLILILWHIVLLAWEKLNYAFGMEWIIAKISEVLIPVKRQTEGEKLKWWKTSRLDSQASLYDVEWIEIIPESGIDHKNLKESKFAFKLALCGFILFPCFILAASIANSAQKTEGVNKYNKRAKILGIIFLTLSIVILVILTMLNTGMVF